MAHVERLGLSRRSFSAAMLAMLAMPGPAMAHTGSDRIAVLDWPWAETLLALKIAPLAVAEAGLYRKRVVTPALPDGTIDLGLRSWPNIELLKSLRPDLILTQANYGISAAILEPIAPTLALPLFTPERRPLHFAEAGLLDIATRLAREPQAEAFLASFNAELEDIRQSLSGYDGRPLLIAKFADDRMLDIYGPGSLFQDVLDRLGLANAWIQSGNHWGFSTAGLDAIARAPEARLVIIEPGPSSSLASSDLWKALPAVRADRVVTIPPTWVFGGMPSARRFAAVLGKALASA